MIPKLALHLDTRAAGDTPKRHICQPHHKPTLFANKLP